MNYDPQKWCSQCQRCRPADEMGRVPGSTRKACQSCRDKAERTREQLKQAKEARA